MLAHQHGIDDTVAATISRFVYVTGSCMGDLLDLGAHAKKTPQSTEKGFSGPSAVMFCMATLGANETQASDAHDKLLDACAYSKTLQQFASKYHMLGQS